MVLSRFPEDADFGFGCTGGGVCFSTADSAGFFLLVLFRCCEANATADAIAGGIMDTAPGGSLMPLGVVTGRAGEKSGTASEGRLVLSGAAGDTVVADGFVFGMLVGTGDGKSCTAPRGSLKPLGVVVVGVTRAIVLGLVDDSGAASGAILSSLGVEDGLGDTIVTFIPLFEGVAGLDGFIPTSEVGVAVENGSSFPCEVGVAMGGACAAG